MSELDTYRLPLSKEEINALPPLSYEGPVHLVQTKAECAAMLKHLKGEALLGFDTESRPSFRRGRSYPTSLIQIAGASEVFLVRLLTMDFDAALSKILADPDVLKVGVAIHDDLRALRKMHEFTPGGVIDLSDLARKHGFSTLGLRSLAANLLRGRVSKSAQCSNWENPILSPVQIRYAATDAWIGRELYLRFLDLDPDLPRPLEAPHSAKPYVPPVCTEPVWPQPWLRWGK